MDCEFSEPVDYNGDVPTSTLDSFQFSRSHCDFTNSTPVLASTSASYIDIASSSALAKGIYDVFGFFFVLGLCIVIYMGFRLGSNFLYKR